MDHAEKRRCAHINLRSRVLFCVEEGSEIKKIWEGAWGEDISVRGVRFFSLVEISQDALLSLKLYLPNKTRPLKAKAKVRWCVAAPDKCSYRVGAEFIAKSETLKHVIVKYVCGDWGQD